MWSIYTTTNLNIFENYKSDNTAHNDALMGQRKYAL